MKQFVCLAVLSVAIFGCKSNTAESSSSATSSLPPDIVAYRNPNGKLECPVMKATIDSEAQAAGYQDYEGKRYYFCCDMCPGKFKENPSLYAAK